jgi:alpha-beta hydrolase superfamily lysophospholipase
MLWMKIKGRRILTAGVCSVLIIAFIWAIIWWVSCGRMPEPIQQQQGYNKGQDLSTQWRNTPAFKKRKGVALVVHGLNLKPERMDAIIIRLNQIGIDVLNVSLRGHGGNYEANKNIPEAEARLESFRTVDYPSWLQEVSSGFDEARVRATRKKVPLFFVGYSLGGLLGCDLVLSNPEKFFDAMILFAPALNIKTETYLLKAMMPFPNLVIDSLSPPSCRANTGTPMAAYKALFEAIDHFEKNINQQLNRPTLLFIDENDEFISCSGIRDMIANHKLDQWRLRIVRKDPEIGDKVSHHLIIDGDSVGKNMWGNMANDMFRHFKR